MRVLFLTKQQYMGKDLLRDRFGRFYEFPRVLAGHGHQVRGVCLKYWDDGVKAGAQPQYLDDVEWQSFKLGWNWPAAFFRHYQRLMEMASDFAPEIVVGASDAVHVMLAASLSSKIGIPLAVDLYDDFESYGATKLPCFKTGLKRGILKASAISTVSNNLAKKVKYQYRATGIVRTISNAICPEIFHPTDKRLARRKLRLPESGLLIGTAGALTANRGLKTLFEAFNELSSARDNVYLVLAGRTESDFPIQLNDKIYYLGELAHADVGDFFNALDVGIVCNRRNQFADYGFPQKYYEMIGCRLPVVAARVGAMQNLLVGYENCLYEPDQADSLADAVNKQINKPCVMNIAVPTWKDRGTDFQQLLEAVLKRSGGRDVDIPSSSGDSLIVDA
jgi:glycosyltransferase involved in cell wall biosynthesis